MGDIKKPPTGDNFSSKVILFSLSSSNFHSMADTLPVQCQQVLDLTQVGIAPTAITFPSVTMTSEKYICVRDSPSSMVIVDPSNPSQPQKRAIAADSAIMHPTHNILALKAQSQLQVYKLSGAQPERAGAHTMNEAVEFWKWIAPQTIAIVTSSAVYHWNLEAGAPALVFHRDSKLVGHQIINYKVNHNLTWNSRLVGHSQLYSTEQKQSMVIDACAVAFGTRTVPGQTSPVTVFCFAARQDAGAGQLFILEVGIPNPSKVNVPLYFPDNAPNDIPLGLEVSRRFSVIYLLTKDGYAHLYDFESGKRITLNQISAEPLLLTCSHESQSGILAINKRGQVLLVTVNEKNIVPFIANSLQDVTLAISLASRGNLPGAEALYQRQFQQLIQTGQHVAAARLAADSPQGILRTPATLALLKSLPASPQGVPLSIYFASLLEKSKLNEAETTELVTPLIQQGRKDLIETWLNADKLHCTEALGDLVRQADPRMALLVFERAKAHHKVVAMHAESAQYDSMVAYAKRENYTPNWMQLLQTVIARNPPAAAAFAKMLVTADGGSLMDINSAIDALMSRGHVKETTALLLDVLSENRAQDAALQTKLFEINLTHAPRVAEALFQNNMYTHFDKVRISKLAEQAGLHLRAIELTENVNDVKRMLTNAQGLTADFLVRLFSRFSVNDTLECLRELLRSNLSANIDGVVAVCVRYTPAPGTPPDPDQLLPSKVIALFEEFSSFQGVYLYLKQIVPLHKTERDLVFKYIEASARLGAVADIEVACKSYDYDPIAVRELLKEVKLSDQLPLVIVCDKHGFVEDLTHYLFRNKMIQFIEAYLQNINPANTPLVVGALLDDNCEESKIKQIVNAVGHLAPVDQLVEEVEKRNKLKILRPWLEARLSEGSRDPAMHNALAKILILTNDDHKEQFLQSNQFYDSATVGRFCEAHEPDLAIMVYKRGGCHQDLINVTNKHGKFKQQAYYLVEQQNPALWQLVLTPDNEHRRALVDQVVQTVLPEIQQAQLVSTTVKAFIDANLPEELIELLDRLVIDSNNPEFSRNPHLQNLLILTAVKSAPTRVIDYVNRLSEYKAPEIAAEALTAGLFEEAFVIYKKFKLNTDAISVLVDRIQDLERGKEFADLINEVPVWSKLARAQLNVGKVADCIASFLRAEDPESYLMVILAAKERNLYDPLVKYLRMARKLKKEKIDTELAFALAETKRLSDLEEFISSPNLAHIHEVGESCYDRGLFDAAKICFEKGNSFARLASTLVQLKKYDQAVEAARKANQISVWKEINKACIDAGEKRLAQICGLNIIVNGEELDELVQYYEQRGKSSELIELLEAGLSNERANQPMFTSLGILYSNYRPEKLMEHLKLFHSRINMGPMCTTCKANEQWKELAFLYQQDREFDKALRVMVDHVDAFDDLVFKELIQRAKNHDLYYDAVRFYIEQHPKNVTDLLHVLRDLIDPVKLVDRVRRIGQLPIIKKFLQSIQDRNLLAVNTALNELYIEELDHESLRISVDSYDSFDAMSLARVLEVSDHLELRRIGAHLYKLHKRWSQSIELSKKDKLYKDAMETAAASQDKDIVESLLRFFVEIESPHSFAACCYTCYDLVRPDVVLELAWKAKMMDFAFPYLIQFVKEYTSKVDTLVEENARLRGAVPPEGYAYPYPPQVPYPPPGAPYAAPQAGFQPPQATPPPPPQSPGFDPNDFSAFQ